MAKDEDKKEIPHVRDEPRPDFSVPPPGKKLPKSIQDTLDNEEKLWGTYYDDIVEGKGGESTDSSLRYAAYATRLRTLLLSAHRYVAYTSDIGESFRPIAHPIAIRAAYGISWLYLAGDVSHEGYKAYLRNQKVLRPELARETVGEAKSLKDEGKGVGEKVKDAVVGTTKEVVGPPPQQQEQQTPGKVPAIEDYRTVMAQRAIFQGLASMGLPAFTIHSIVRYSGRALKDAKNVRVRTWGPIGLGLAAVPALPYMFDEPVEKAVEWVFHKGFEIVGGAEAVGQQATGGKPVKEKEL
ncbi:hypothetical protein K402DRAFT_397368 [Aulographum hederae CBS 113979]|uniref:Mitochondrial fission process protein 1 n=1 Tax=Aulographum hederae CBS 113979 TaxID=1176131 RepID=A0A6G1GPA4_9PEZI|nr:hypothetical protein K402DRAFT_397368 [Aulographum hederae CBS 113979]